MMDNSEGNGSNLIKKVDKLFASTERENARATWEILSEFILPNQSGVFVGDDTKGGKKTARLFDGTAPMANHDLASAFQTTLTNPASKWSKISFKDDALNNDSDAVQWLEQVNNTIHDSFSESNFDTMLSKNYQAFTSLGTMVLFHEEADRELAGTFEGFRFEAWHLSQVALAENKDGAVDTVYRKFKLTAKQAAEKFEENTPEKIVEMAEKEPSKEFEFYHCIFKRDKKDIKLDDNGLAPGRDRPVASIYISKEGSEVVEETGYYEFPVYANRWSTLPCEVYGRGPGHLALPDTRTLNRIKDLGLQSINKAINPPMLASRRNVLGALDLRPGQITVVQDVDGFREMVPQARYDVTQFAVEDLKASIKTAFFIDKLLLPPRTETGEMTAFEVRERLQQMQKVLGPVLSRLNSEFLSPLVLRSFKILLRAGALPELPQILIDQGISVDIKFINSLSRSQQAEDINNISAYFQGLMQVAQAKPEVLDWFDADGFAKHVSKLMSVPETVITNDDQVEDLREQRAQQAQQQQAMEAGVAAADIAAKTQGGGGQGG